MEGCELLETQQRRLWPGGVCLLGGESRVNPVGVLLSESRPGRSPEEMCLFVRMRAGPHWAVRRSPGRCPDLWKRHFKQGEERGPGGRFPAPS